MEQRLLARQFKLTRAYQRTTAPVTLPPTAQNRVQLYEYSSPTATKARSISGSYTYNPAFAYTTK